MEKLDEKQLSALAEMTQKFEAVNGIGMPMNDKTFLRYLRARNFNVAKATKLLESTVEWRKKFGLQNFQEEWKDIIKLENASGKMYLRGFDKQGHILIYMKPANENTKDHAGNMKHLVYMMERAIACMEATTGQEKLSLVIDYTGFSLGSAPPMKSSKETLSILQDHYPERLFRAYCIRPPTVFYAFYKLITPFIDKVTKQKICMLTNSDMSKPENQLLRDVEKSVLEPSLGGEAAVPFDSEMFLNAPFTLDYNAILEQK